jgi:hypothetical protein
MIAEPLPAGDEVYGGHPKLRERLETGQISYVLAVACAGDPGARSSHQTRLSRSQSSARDVGARPAWADFRTG